VGSLLLAFHFPSARRGCGNVGIARRFPRAVERVENLLLVFQAFHGPSFPKPLAGLQLDPIAIIRLNCLDTF